MNDFWRLVVNKQIVIFFLSFTQLNLMSFNYIYIYNKFYNLLNLKFYFTMKEFKNKSGPEMINSKI